MDYLITAEDGTEYLAHYGVLGMKWGVRKDRSSAYGKSMAKLAKLDAKAVKIGNKRQARQDRITSRFGRNERAGKMQAKAAKLEAKAGKLERKAGRQAARYDWNGYSQTTARAAGLRSRANRLKDKSIGNDNRTKNLAYKEEKAKYKAQKWASRMNKEFGSTKMSSTAEQRKLGKKYVLSMVK